MTYPVSAQATSAKKDLLLNLPWFETPFFEEELAKRGLNAEDEAIAKHFAEHGFVVFDPKINNFHAKADEAIAALAPNYGNKAYNGDMVRLQDAWEYNAHAKEFATAPRVMEVLAMLYGRAPIPFQTLNFRVGTEQRTHSDSIHFHCVPERFMCGVWIALEDVDAENGPLHYYPGSHKLPVYDLADVGLTATSPENLKEPGPYYGEYLNLLDALIAKNGLQKHEVRMKKGQALIWATNLYHGGSPIIDKARTRHSQVTHYYFDGCMYYTPMKTGKFLGKYFWRQIRNIATGQVVPQFYNGERVDVPPGVDTSAPPPVALVNNVVPLGVRIKGKIKRTIKSVLSL